MMLSLVIAMIKHSESTKSNMFAISLQYLQKKKLEMEFIFWRSDFLHFYKLALFFLMEVARHVQSIQNKKVVIFLQYIKKKVSQLLLCSSA